MEKSKCRCGKDHTNDKPVNEEEVVKEMASDIARQIDENVISRLSSVEEVDDIVLDELILAYMMNIEYDKDEGGIYMERDEELLDALEKVIEYYSSVSEYNSFVSSYKTKRYINAQTNS